MRLAAGVVVGFVLLFGFLVACSAILNLPLLLALRLARRRLHPAVPRALLSAGFAAAAAYMLWRMEWFDVWRHGVPPVSYIVTAYVPWIAAIGVVGWGAGVLVAGRRVGSVSP